MKEQVAHHLTLERPGGEYIDCTNPSCEGGGFSMGNILREAISGKKEKILPVRMVKPQEDGVCMLLKSVVLSSIKLNKAQLFVILLSS